MTVNLTEFQANQLMHLKLEGSFQYKNEHGNRYPRGAWRKMIQVLRDNGLIDLDLQLTPKGLDVCDQIHYQRHPNTGQEIGKDGSLEITREDFFQHGICECPRCLGHFSGAFLLKPGNVPCPFKCGHVFIEEDDDEAIAALTELRGLAAEKHLTFDIPVDEDTGRPDPIVFVKGIPVHFRGKHWYSLLPTEFSPKKADGLTQVVTTVQAYIKNFDVGLQDRRSAFLAHLKETMAPDYVKKQTQRRKEKARKMLEGGFHVSDPDALKQLLRSQQFNVPDLRALAKLSNVHLHGMTGKANIVGILMLQQENREFLFNLAVKRTCLAEEIDFLTEQDRAGFTVSQERKDEITRRLRQFDEALTC